MHLIRKQIEKNNFLKRGHLEEANQQMYMAKEIATSERRIKFESRSTIKSEFCRTKRRLRYFSFVLSSIKSHDIPQPFLKHGETVGIHQNSTF